MNIINWKTAGRQGWPRTSQPSVLGQQQPCPLPPQKQLTPPTGPTSNAQWMERRGHQEQHFISSWLVFIQLVLKSMYFGCIPMMRDENGNGSIIITMQIICSLGHTLRQDHTALQSTMTLDNFMKTITKLQRIIMFGTVTTHRKCPINYYWC